MITLLIVARTLPNSPTGVPRELHVTLSHPRGLLCIWPGKHPTAEA